MRECWFSIIDITEPRGRSMADIANDIIKRRKVSLHEVRSDRRDRFIVSVRREIIGCLMQERKDLSSCHIAQFLNRDSATIRHHWRDLAA